MRRTRFITICLAALLAMAIGPAWATAAPQTIVDDNLATGTPDGNTHVFGDDVYINETQWDNQGFEAGVPGTWSSALWEPTGSVTPDPAALRIDGARVFSGYTLDAPKALKFDGIFAASTPFQNMGVGTDFNAEPWAMFSTGGGALPVGFYARTLVNGVPQNEELLGIDPTVFHDYEIRWTANQVTFYVDGNLVSTHNVALPNGLRFIASDAQAGGGAFLLDGIKFLSFSPEGTFASQVRDAGPNVGNWGTLTAAGNLTDATFRTRTGNTETPDASWSDWQALGAGGVIQSPERRYIQYEATLSSLGGVYGARLNSVTINYDTDSTAPTTVLDEVNVSGTTATATFSSPDADVARFECKLDGGDYATCTSPKVYGGLAVGDHTVSVRAVDNANNVGTAVSKTITIAAQPGGGGTPGGGTPGGGTPGGGTPGGGTPGGGTPGGGTTTVDRLAPKVVLSPRSVRASSTGKVAFRVKCPKAEQRCKIAVQLKRGRKAASSKKTVSVRGGKTLKVTLALNKATRKYLSTHARLKVTAVTVARDAVGNSATKRVKVTLRAPRP